MVKKANFATLKQEATKAKCGVKNMKKTQTYEEASQEQEEGEILQLLC